MQSDPRADERDALETGHFDRKEFLGGLLTGAAGAAVFGAAVGAPTAVAALGRTNARGELEAEGVLASGLVYRITYGPDGFPVGSIQGTMIGSEGNALLLAVNNGARTIRLHITGKTNVWAAGRNRVGDVSDCQPGDHIQAGTFFDASSNRVAEFLTANPLATWMYVDEDATDNYVNVYWQGTSWMYGGLTAALFTRVVDQDTGTESTMDSLKAGNYLHVSSMTDVPGDSWRTCWPIVIRNFGSPPAGFSVP